MNVVVICNNTECGQNSSEIVKHYFIVLIREYKLSKNHIITIKLLILKTYHVNIYLGRAIGL